MKRFSRRLFLAGGIASTAAAARALGTASFDPLSRVEDAPFPMEEYPYSAWEERIVDTARYTAIPGGAAGTDGEPAAVRVLVSGESASAVPIATLPAAATPFAPSAASLHRLARSKGRVTSPLLRGEDGARAPVTWDRAVSYLAESIRKNPGAIAVACDPAAGAVTGSGCLLRAAGELGASHLPIPGDAGPRRPIASPASLREADAILAWGCDLFASRSAYAIAATDAVSRGSSLLSAGALFTLTASRAALRIPLDPEREPFAAAALAAALQKDENAFVRFLPHAGLAAGALHTLVERLRRAKKPCVVVGPEFGLPVSTRVRDLHLIDAAASLSFDEIPLDLRLPPDPAAHPRLATFFGQRPPVLGAPPRLLWIAGRNVATEPGGAALLAAVRAAGGRIAVHATVWNETCDAADLILPAPAPLEQTAADIVVSSDGRLYFALGPLAPAQDARSISNVVASAVIRAFPTRPSGAAVFWQAAARSDLAGCAAAATGASTAQIPTSPGLHLLVSETPNGVVRARAEHGSLPAPTVPPARETGTFFLIRRSSLAAGETASNAPRSDLTVLLDPKTNRDLPRVYLSSADAEREGVSDVGEIRLTTTVSNTTAAARAAVSAAVPHGCLATDDVRLLAEPPDPYAPLVVRLVAARRTAPIPDPVRAAYLAGALHRSLPAPAPHATPRAAPSDGENEKVARAENRQLGREMKFVPGEARPIRQWAQVIDLNRCDGCQACALACKSTYTARRGTESAWWQSVEWMPAPSYPFEWDSRTLDLLARADTLPNERIAFVRRTLFEAAFYAKRRAERVTGYSPAPTDYRSPADGEGRAGLDENGAPFSFPLPRTCAHCSFPACLAACPRNAIYKRRQRKVSGRVQELEGIVLVDPDRCRGYRKCIEACPYKKVYFNAESGVSEACHGCLPRIARGESPVCVTVCPLSARLQGFLSDSPRAGNPVDHLVKIARVALPLYPQFGTEPNLYYLPPANAPIPYLAQMFGNYDEEVVRRALHGYASPSPETRAALRLFGATERILQRFQIVGNRVHGVDLAGVVAADVPLT